MRTYSLRVLTPLKSDLLVSMATYWNGLYCIPGSRPHKWTHALAPPTPAVLPRAGPASWDAAAPAVARCLGVSFDVAASKLQALQPGNLQIP